MRPPRTSFRRKHSETTRGPQFESRAHAMGLSEDGFSLVELLISAILLTVLMAAIVMAVRMSQTVHNTTQQSLELQQNVRASISMISRELLNAGSGLPYLSQINGNPAIAVPAAAKLGPLGAPVGGASVNFVTPRNQTGQSVTKDGEGGTLATPIQTDILTFLGGQGEARFVLQTVPGPSAGYGSTVYLENAAGFSVGNVLLFTNGFQVSLGVVTALLPGGGLVFNNGDSLALNPTASAGTPNPNAAAALQFPGGPPPQALPMASISYFIDSATDPAHPSLKRLANNAGGVAAAVSVMDDIENLQVTYLVDQDANATTPDVVLDAPTTAELTLVRGLTLSVTGRSKVRMEDAAFPDRHTRLTMNQTVFFRNNIRR
jgi:type II secretory pathway pseudopilin PulG